MYLCVCVCVHIFRESKSGHPSIIYEDEVSKDELNKKPKYLSIHLSLISFSGVSRLKYVYYIQHDEEHAAGVTGLRRKGGIDWLIVLRSKEKHMNRDAQQKKHTWSLNCKFVFLLSNLYFQQPAIIITTTTIDGTINFYELMIVNLVGPETGWSPDLLSHCKPGRRRREGRRKEDSAWIINKNK